MNCKHCGAKNPAENKFCGHCGRALAELSQPRPAAAAPDKKPRAHSRMMMAATALVFIGFVCWSIARPEPEPIPPAPPPAQRPADPAGNAPAHLQMTAGEFKTAFNRAAEDSGRADFKIDSIPVQKGYVQDSFRVVLTDALVMIGVVDPQDHFIRQITLIGAGSRKLSENDDAYIALELLIAGATPGLSAAERRALIVDAGIVGAGPHQGKLTRYGKTFTFSRSKESGLSFTVANAAAPQ